jgi:predicted GIY-YIG superfamily endonuclease
MSDTIKCESCGSTWNKDHIKRIKQYNCQMCATMRVYTPHKIEYYAPFSSVEEAVATQTAMRNQMNNLYYGARHFWSN